MITVLCVTSTIPRIRLGSSTVNNGGYNFSTRSTQSAYWATMIVGVVLSVYSASLGTTGLPDRENYIVRYLMGYDISPVQLISATGEEIGYKILNTVIRHITTSPFWLFFIITLIASLVNIRVLLGLTSDLTGTVSLYLVSLYFFYTTYLFRQSLAVAIGNLAFLALLKNKKILYFVFSVIATAFHSSAVILFPLYFVYQYTRSAKVYLVVIGFFLVLLFGFEPLIGTILRGLSVDKYVSSYELVRGGGSATTVLRGLPFFVICGTALFRRKRIKKLYNKADMLIVASVVYSMCWILSYNVYWFFRVGWYVMLPTLALTPLIFKTMGDVSQRLLCKHIVYVVLLLITLRQVYITLQ